MELRPEDVSLLERCPHFRGCYVEASMELGPEDVPIREVSSFQRAVCTISLPLAGVQLHEACGGNLVHEVT